MRPRSQAVTVMSVILLAWYGLGAFMGVLCGAALLFLLPHDLVDRALNDPELESELPLLTRFLRPRIFWLFLIQWAFSPISAVCAYGVWKRREWARTGMIGMLILQIMTACIAPMLVAGFILSNADTHVLPGPLVLFMYVVTVIAVMPSVLYAVCFGWFAHLLTRPEVKREFA